MQSDSPLQYELSLKWQVSKYLPGALNFERSSFYSLQSLSVAKYELG